MKRLIFVLALIFILKALSAQTKQKIDSLKKVIATTTQDTAKVIALGNLTSYELNHVKRLSILNEALTLARKIQFEKGEALCYIRLGLHFQGISDYPQALEYHFKALKIHEKLNDIPMIVGALSDIGQLYKFQQNNEAALAYYFKASGVLKQNKGGSWAIVNKRIGDIYLDQNELDSALIYFTRSYEHGNTKSGKGYLRFILIGLGNVHSALGNTELAFSFYRMSIANTKQNIYLNKNDAFAQSYLGLAKLFMKTGIVDSAIYYAKQALIISGQNTRNTISGAKLLARLYENRDGNEAYRYLKMATDAQDSVFSGSNTARIQSLSFIEQERQRELNESKLKEVEERKHNLQFAALAIGLITFIILFFALSRSIIVKTKFIEFFGILGLLAVFEFINLFIHPYLSHATNDSPVLMLLVLILIGAMLVPLHHKLEKWITKVMVEKNKKIRLEAARKTIASLEPN